MPAAATGFALPLKYDDVRPGMLIVARQQDAVHYSLAFAGAHELKLAVFASTGTAATPFVVDLTDVYQAMAKIDGALEVRPGRIDEMLLPLKVTTSKEGIFVDSTGSVGIAVVEHEYGQNRWRYLSFETGEDHKGRASLIFPRDPKLFIRQEGRKDLMEIPSALSLE